MAMEPIASAGDHCSNTGAPTLEHSREILTVIWQVSFDLPSYPGQGAGLNSLAYNHHHHHGGFGLDGLVVCLQLHACHSCSCGFQIGVIQGYVLKPASVFSFVSMHCICSPSPPRPPPNSLLWYSNYIILFKRYFHFMQMNVTLDFKGRRQP